jgi:hypothetical protein
VENPERRDNPGFYLGAELPVDGRGHPRALYVPAHHLVTHGVVVGMTGSGKTGLVTVLVEEALRNRVPVLVIDVKGDLPNLLLGFGDFEARSVEPWIEGPPSSTFGPAPPAAAHGGGGIVIPNMGARPTKEEARSLLAMHDAEERRASLAAWGIGATDIADYRARSAVRVITPGADAGELLHVLSSLERRSERWDRDPEGARGALSAAISLVLRLLGRDSDPARSREHVLLSVLAERRLSMGMPADLASLLGELASPPVDRIGALAIDAFLPKRKRTDLAAALNNILAAPSFASWRQGATLDVAEWMQRRDGKTPATIISVAHLDDDERSLVLGVVLEEVLSWVRSLPGSQRLRALVVFDEVYGYLPPHPANPPTKKPLVALMKQARAFGVGVVVATQNPMDLDYRALGNAGMWCLGRLQTDADRARVVDGRAGADAGVDDADDLDEVLKRLAPRWFVMRDAHAASGSILLQPRWTMSYMKGPMTRVEIQRARMSRGAA